MEVRMSVRIPARISGRIFQVNSYFLAVVEKVKWWGKFITTSTAEFTAKFTWTIWGKIHKFLLPSRSGRDFWEDNIGDGPTTVSESMVSNTELSELFFSTSGLTIWDGLNTVLESTASNTELNGFFGPSRVRGGGSLGSSEPVICVPKRAHQVLYARSGWRVSQMSLALEEPHARCPERLLAPSLLDVRI